MRILIRRMYVNTETGLLTFLIQVDYDDGKSKIRQVVISNTDYQTVKTVPAESLYNITVEQNRKKDNTVIVCLYSCTIKKGKYRLRLLGGYKNKYYQFVGKKRLNKPIEMEGDAWKEFRDTVLTKFSSVIIYIDQFTKLDSLSKLRNLLRSLIY